MYKLSRRTKTIKGLLNAVSIRNGQKLIMQELADPKLIPLAIALDRIGINLKDLPLWS